MIRGILAILGGVAVAATGLAGPTGTSDVGGQGDIFFAAVTQQYYDLATNSSTPESLEGLGVVGCVDTNPTLIVFITSYSSVHIVPALGVFRTADPAYTGISDATWEAPSGVLHSSTFQLELFAVAAGRVLDITSSNARALHPVCVAQLPSNQ